MKIINLEDEKEERIDCDVTSIKKENWVASTYDVTTQNDLHGLGDLTKASNVNKLAMTMKTFQFADNVTMHGLRYVFMRNISQARRIAWLLIVLGGTAYCTFLFYQTLHSYLEYPTATKIRTQFEVKSELPAITLCNFNVLMKRKLTPLQQQLVGHVFADMPLPEGVRLEDYDDVDVEQFFRNKGFDYDFSFCLHKEKPCNRSLISYHVTDFGVCVTFDPGMDSAAKYQTTAGQAGGFNFVAVFERDDWTLGPHYMQEGFRVALHESGTKPHVLKENGISLLPALYSEILLSRRETKILPPPHGQCGIKNLEIFPEYSNKHCMLECKTKHVVSLCGCKLVYLPGTAPPCTFKQSADCRLLMKHTSNESNLFDASKCDCPQDCVSTHFNYHVTLTKPSEGYSEIVRQIYHVNVSEAVGLKVYYEDLKYFDEIEEPVYTVEKLLCDVGGATGLFLGCSFVTFFEFMDFIVEFVWFWCVNGAFLKRDKSIKIDSMV